MNVSTRTGFTVDAIDVFCGFGGSSQGIHAAGAEVRVAANHNALAIECHARNFPGTDHRRADLVDPESGDYMDAADLPRARFAWFSPGCQHHSPANAEKLYERGRQAGLFDDDEDFDYAAYARSERSRVTMSCVLRYAERNRPELIVVENVVEVCHWGPGRDGTTFAWWKRTLEGLGYETECCFFNSQFFPPCPQSRDRIYVVAWRKGNRRPDLDHRPAAYCTSDACGGRHVNAVQAWKQPKKSWPLPRWGKYAAQYVYRCPDCGSEVFPVAWPALTAINWSNLGPMIGERAGRGMKPLSPAQVTALMVFGLWVEAGEREEMCAGLWRDWPIKAALLFSPTPEAGTGRKGASG
jgi:DNA (cytosine-5)-methyltransferase 1